MIMWSRWVNERVLAKWSGLCMNEQIKNETQLLLNSGPIDSLWMWMREWMVKKINFFFSISMIDFLTRPLVVNYFYEFNIFAHKEIPNLAHFCYYFSQENTLMRGNSLICCLYSSFINFYLMNRIEPYFNYFAFLFHDANF